MTVKFACERCLQTLVAAEHKIGQSVPCPRCHATLVVPNEERAAALLEIKRRAREQSGRDYSPSPAPGGSQPAPAQRATEPAAPKAAQSSDQRKLGPETLGAETRSPEALGKRKARSSPPSLPETKKTKAPAGRSPGEEAGISAAERASEKPSEKPTEKPAERTTERPAEKSRRDSSVPPSPSSSSSRAASLSPIAPTSPGSLEHPEQAYRSPAATPNALPDGVMIRRGVLFAQAALIALVAVIAYVSGYLSGGSGGGASSSPGETQASAAKAAPAIIAGKVRYRPDRKPAEADADAVVLALPRGAAVSEKIKVAGLRPEDPRPAENNPQTRILESLDGGYARADRSGNFQLSLRPGPYLVLAISRHAKRPKGHPIPPADLSLLEQYFAPAKDLVGQAKFELGEHDLAEGRPLDFEF